jgi:hypothetical protein
MYFKEFPTILYDFDVNTTTTKGRIAKATANLSADGVGSVSISDQGSGYTTASVTFSQPENTGVTASAYAVISDGKITNIIMKNAGGGYIQPPTVVITPPYGNIKKQTKAYALTDISRNIRFRKEVLSNITTYESYDIMDGETPEIIAEKIYGNAEYHWIIMLANDMYDYRKDFPLTQLQLEKYVSDKYGEDADDVHHYVNEQGFIVNSNTSGAVSISNRQYEESVNESKRRIKIISKNIIGTILNNFKDQL